VVGELLSDLLMQQQPRFDWSPFRLKDRSPLRRA
jgi:hypothetical protein